MNIKTIALAGAMCVGIIQISCNTDPGKTKAEKTAYVVEQAFKNKEFIGNVLVASEGHVIYKKSFGKSIAAANGQNNDSTRFLIDLCQNL